MLNELNLNKMLGSLEKWDERSAHKTWEQLVFFMLDMKSF